MKTKLFFVCFLLFISIVLYPQGIKTNVIQLNLVPDNNNEFVLRINIFANHDFTTYNPPNFVKFNGIKKGNSWTFYYPDTLYDKSVSLTIQDTTHIDLIRYIAFKYICNKDTLKTDFYSFANQDTTIIDATYLQTDTVKFPVDRDVKGNAIFETYLIDYYFLTSFQDKELLSSLEATKSSFHGNDIDYSQYDIELDKYVDLVKKYPDSHSLIQMLEWSLPLFKSKNDIQKVFDCFSQETKDSFYGKRVNQYLTDNHFKNTILKAWDTGKSEAIVLDSTKYNLIIFSSIGCKPCIEEIPILKKIYGDLAEKLEMTYVSIDHSRTVEEWRQLMRKENIPWRSVLAEDETGKIQEKYHVRGIPYCLFVHPGGFMEPIDVRVSTELNYLYKAVQ